MINKYALRIRRILFNFLVKVYLRNKGVKYGRQLQATGLPKVIRSRDSTIAFGNNVVLRKGVELRATDKSKLTIGDNSIIDNGVRIIAGNSKELSIGEKSKIGYYSVINGGGGVKIADEVSLYGFVYIQTSTHLDRGHLAIDQSGEQKYVHKPVEIGTNSLIGAHVSILPGVSIGENVTVGANAVVTHDINENSFVAGVPAKVLSI